MKEIYPEPEIPVDKIIRVMYLALNEAESIMNDSKMPKYVANTNKFKEAESKMEEYLKRVHKVHKLEVFKTKWVSNKNTNQKTINNGNDRHF